MNVAMAHATGLSGQSCCMTGSKGLHERETVLSGEHGVQGRLTFTGYHAERRSYKLPC